MDCDRTTVVLNVLIGALLLYNLVVYQPPIEKWALKSARDQHRVTTLGPLLNEGGQLVELGWSLRYHQILNLERARFSWLSLALPLWPFYKKLDSYVFTFNRRIFYLTLADLGHSQAISMTFFDLDLNDVLYSTSEFRPKFFRGAKPLAMPDDPFEVEANDYSFEGRRVTATFAQQKNTLKSTFSSAITIVIGGEFKAKLLSERFTAQNDFFEASTSTGDRASWVYSLKSYESACEGFISHQGKYHSLLHSNCISMTGYQRGYQRYKSGWVWVSGQGRSLGGSHLSVNFGTGVGRTGRAESVEDFFKTSGVLHKLSPVEVGWAEEGGLEEVVIKTLPRFEGGVSTAQVVFKPMKRVVTVRNLFFVTWNVELVFGTMSGTVVGENAVAVTFEGVPAMMERAKMKW